MNKAVQIVLLNNDGEVLAVSRKDDHSDFGLVGGSVEPNESITDAAIREAKEETGLDVFNLRMIFSMHRNDYMGYTYLADYSGEIQTEEDHVVKWTNFQTIIDGKFGKWNKMVSESLTSMDIKFKL